MAVENDWQATPAADTGTGFDLKRMLWSRLWLLLICAGAGAGVGYYQFTKQPEVYSSSGQLLLKRSQSAITVEGVADYGVKDPIEEHLELIRKGRILNDAVERILARDQKVSSIEALGTPERMAAVISARLSAVRPNPRTNFITLTYTSPVQAECQPVLEAVFFAYEAYLTADQKQSSESMVARVEEAKKVLDVDLKRKREEYATFRSRTQLLLSGNQEQNLHQDRVLKIEEERSKLLLREREINANLAAIESAKQRGTSRDVLMIIAEQMSSQSKDATGATTEDGVAAQLIPLMVEAELLKENLGKGHPDVKKIELKIDVMKRLLAPTGSTTGAPKDFLTLYVESLQEELRVVVQKGLSMTAFYMEELKASRAMGEEAILNQEYLGDIKRTQDLYDVILKKLEQIQLVKENDTFSVERISPPSAGYKTGPDQNRFLTMGSVGGLFAGIFLSFLLELSDRSFTSANEISTYLGVQVIGHIPQIGAERGAKIVKSKLLDKNLAVFQRPGSRVAEAFRGLRTAVMFGSKDQSHSVIQVTSPDPSDGKSTTSSNLAAALAGAGKKVLLIDVDLRKPKQQEIFQVELKQGGVTSVITGDKTLDEVIQETAIENLFLITAGPIQNNPGELILNPKFAEIIATLKTRYDFVIVDTPPVLPVTDAATIAQFVDGIVLVFRISKHSKPHAKDALQTLQMVNGNIIGVVVNGLGSNSGYSYGYGRYGSKYKSGSYGQYGYGIDQDSPIGRGIEQQVAK